jgi:hypothetical protein
MKKKYYYLKEKITSNLMKERKWKMCNQTKKLQNYLPHISYQKVHIQSPFLSKAIGQTFGTAWHASSCKFLAKCKFCSSGGYHSGIKRLVLKNFS